MEKYEKILVVPDSAVFIRDKWNKYSIAISALLSFLEERDKTDIKYFRIRTRDSLKCKDCLEFVLEWEEDDKKD